MELYLAPKATFTLREALHTTASDSFAVSCALLHAPCPAGSCQLLMITPPPRLHCSSPDLPRFSFTVRCPPSPSARHKSLWDVLIPHPPVLPLSSPCTRSLRGGLPYPSRPYHSTEFLTVLDDSATACTYCDLDPEEVGETTSTRAGRRAATCSFSTQWRPQSALRNCISPVYISLCISSNVKEPAEMLTCVKK